MDLATGEFFVTELSDFSSACSEVFNLKAREVVLGFSLTQDQENQLNPNKALLLSQESEILEDDHLLDKQLTVAERQVAGKLLQYVQKTQMRELSHLQQVVHYEIKDYLQMSYATKIV